MVNLYQLTTLLLTVVLVASSNLPQPKDFAIVKVEKQVTLGGLYPTETDKLQFRCLLNICPLSFRHIVPRKYDNSIISIYFGKDKTALNSYSFSKGDHQHDSNDYAVYDVNIGRELVKDETSSIIISILYINRYVNFPESITLSEDQKLQYEDNKYFVSMYDVSESTVNYKFSRILSFDKDGQKKGLSSVTFKKTEYPSYMTDKHVVHGVNNQPQVVFSEVERIIEVSHWGNIAITQFYKIKNTGPSMKGQFSRIQFSSQNKFEAKNAFKGIQTQLPYKIWGLYYRDEVGNISTSKAYRDDMDEVVRFALTPRFALLGGWKANWQIGYNLNTQGYLKVQDNNFELRNIPLGYALNKVMSESYSIKVILPEDSKNTKITVGNNVVDMKNVEKSLSFGYLDFSGRPVYTVKGLNGIFEKKQIKVQYNYEATGIFKKPFYIFGAISSLLMLVVIVKRLNFSAFEEHSKPQ